VQVEVVVSVAYVADRCMRVFESEIGLGCSRLRFRYRISLEGREVGVSLNVRPSGVNVSQGCAGCVGCSRARAADWRALCVAVLGLGFRAGYVTNWAVRAGVLIKRGGVGLPRGERVGEQRFR